MIQIKLLLDTSMSARVLAAPYPFWQVNAQTQCLRTRVPAHRTGGDRSAASKALHFARCLCGCNMLNPEVPIFRCARPHVGLPSVFVINGSRSRNAQVSV